MNKVWKETEKQFVKDNCDRMTDEILSEKLTNITGRKVSIHAVRKLRQNMGLRKKPGRGVCGLVAPLVEVPVVIETLPKVREEADASE